MSQNDTTIIENQSKPIVPQRVILLIHICNKQFKLFFKHSQIFIKVMQDCSNVAQVDGLPKVEEGRAVGSYTLMGTKGCDQSQKTKVLVGLMETFPGQTCTFPLRSPVQCSLIYCSLCNNQYRKLRGVCGESNVGKEEVDPNLSKSLQR